jgi:hypothetical protein
MRAGNILLVVMLVFFVVAGIILQQSNRSDEAYFTNNVTINAKIVKITDGYKKTDKRMLLTDSAWFDVPQKAIGNIFVNDSVYKQKGSSVYVFTNSVTGKKTIYSFN